MSITHVRIELGFIVNLPVGPPQVVRVPLIGIQRVATEIIFKHQIVIFIQHRLTDCVRRIFLIHTNVVQFIVSRKIRSLIWRSRPITSNSQISNYIHGLIGNFIFVRSYTPGFNTVNVPDNFFRIPKNSKCMPVRSKVSMFGRI